MDTKVVIHRNYENSIIRRGAEPLNKAPVGESIFDSSRIEDDRCWAPGRRGTNGPAYPLRTLSLIRQIPVTVLSKEDQV